MGTIITPAVLVRLLEAEGYCVTERCLTDWRQKGDMPQLSRRSRGYRAGVVWYWPESNILEIALAVCRRRKGPKRKRTKRTAWKNWLNGANIPALRAKNAYLAVQGPARGISGKESRKCAAAFSKGSAIGSSYFRDIVEEVFDIWTKPDHRPGVDLDISFLSSFIREALTSLGAPKNRPIIPEEKLAEVLTCINSVLSPAGFRNLIARATPRELQDARDCYLNWWKRRERQIVVDGGQEIAPPSISSLDDFWRGLRDLLAPLIVPLLLAPRTQYAAPAPSQAVSTRSTKLSAEPLARTII